MKGKGPKVISIEQKMGMDIEEILKKAVSGKKSMHKVAEELGIPHQTLMYWIDKYKIQYTTPIYCGDIKLIDIMRQLRKEKMSFEDIGKKFGYTADQVYARLKKRALEKSS